MSSLVDRHLSAKKKERLHLQREWLLLMLASHRNWMQSTIDSETQHIHQEIAELIQKAAYQDGMLLDRLQAQDNE